MAFPLSFFNVRVSLNKVVHGSPLIFIDSTAFLYQSSVSNFFGRLTILRLTPLVFSEVELGDLRSNFGDASSLTTEK
jgi:hypothetical protein